MPDGSIRVVGRTPPYGAWVTMEIDGVDRLIRVDVPGNEAVLAAWDAGQARPLDAEELGRAIAWTYAHPDEQTQAERYEGISDDEDDEDEQHAEAEDDLQARSIETRRKLGGPRLYLGPRGEVIEASANPDPRQWYRLLPGGSVADAIGVILDQAEGDYPLPVDPAVLDLPPGERTQALEGARWEMYEADGPLMRYLPEIRQQQGLGPGARLEVPAGATPSAAVSVSRALGDLGRAFAAAPRRPTVLVAQAAGERPARVQVPFGAGRGDLEALSLVDPDPSRWPRSLLDPRRLERYDWPRLVDKYEEFLWQHPQAERWLRAFQRGVPDHETFPAEPLGEAMRGLGPIRRFRPPEEHVPAMPELPLGETPGLPELLSPPTGERLRPEMPTWPQQIRRLVPLEQAWPQILRGGEVA